MAKNFQVNITILPYGSSKNDLGVVQFAFRKNFCDRNKFWKCKIYTLTRRTVTEWLAVPGVGQYVIDKSQPQEWNYLVSLLRALGNFLKTVRSKVLKHLFLQGFPARNIYCPIQGHKKKCLKLKKVLCQTLEKKLFLDISYFCAESTRGSWLNVQGVSNKTLAFSFRLLPITLCQKTPMCFSAEKCVFFKLVEYVVCSSQPR